MSSPHITYVGRPDNTFEGELSALAAIYKFCLERSHEQKNAAGVTSTNGDDAKERFEDDSSAKTIIPDR